MQDPDSKFRRHLNRMSELITDGGSLSGRERNCAFLNMAGSRFATVSAVSGLDHIDDARSPARVDWDRDGDIDLWVANRTAPQLRLLRNDTPHSNHFVAIRLQGTTSNRDGIGARVEVWRTPQASDSKQVPLIKTLQAGDGFLGQSTKWLHFGLGDSTKITKVIVKWPGGKAEGFSNVNANQWHRLKEGQGTAEVITVTPLEQSHDASDRKLAASQLVSPTPARRIATSTRTGLPPLRYKQLDGSEREIVMGNGKPVLINLWASWCAPCVAELKEWKQHAAEFSANDLTVYTLSTEGLDQQKDFSTEERQNVIEKLDLPFQMGIATDDLFVRLEQAHNWPFRRRVPLPIPTSFLVDGKGRLTVIYRGTVSAEQVVADTTLFRKEQDALQDAVIPFPGTWLTRPKPPRPMTRGVDLMTEGDVTDAAEFVRRNLELLKPHKEFGLLSVWVGEELMKVGETKNGMQFLEYAAEGKSPNLTVLNNLAWQYAANPDPRVRNPALALRWAQKANAETKSNNPAVLDTLAVSHAAAGQFQEAVVLTERAIRIATSTRNKELTKMLKEHLELFQANKPYLDPAPGE